MTPGLTSQLVAVDIGGTHARFALARIAQGTVRLGPVVTLATDDYARFEDAWAAFAQQCDHPLPTAAAIAVAGPVPEPQTNATIRLTNSGWTLAPATLPAALGLARLVLVNDFCAVAHAVAATDDSDFLHLCGPDQPLPPRGTITVVGPGTGLGVAHLWRDGTGPYHVQPTEGGHIGFAPLDEVEDRILARLRQRHGRVSAERVVSGPAIVDIAAVLAAMAGADEPPRDDRALWQSGIAGRDPLATAAVERFCQSLGAVAGDLALAQGAGGVVIAGGVGLRLRDRLAASGFAARFRAKGRFESLLAAMPVKLIVHPQPGLFGAAAAFAKDHAA